MIIPFSYCLHRTYIVYHRSEKFSRVWRLFLEIRLKKFHISVDKVEDRCYNLSKHAIWRSVWTINFSVKK